MESRSAKVYKILVNNLDDLLNPLNKMSSTDKTKFPRTDNVKKLQNGDIEGKIWVSKPNLGDIPCVFLFKKKTKKLYLLGPNDARGLAYGTLNKLNGEEGFIQEANITNRQLVDDIRKKLTEKDPDNFIKKISLEFGLTGIKYYNQTNLYKLDYELIQNKCGSTHRSFDKFVDSANIIKVKFGIKTLFSVDRSDKNANPAPMNMRTDFALSFYFDILDKDWYDILDYLVKDMF